MAYVPGYENDIFVSYAHVDNIPLSGISKGWVETQGKRTTIKIKGLQLKCHIIFIL
jgi:hypothetical protein